MKTISSLVFSLMFSIQLSFADIHYYHIDTLNRGQGIDLDSNVLRATGWLNGRASPYAQGPNYDSSFNADFAASPCGLTWCNCDANAWLTFFNTYKCKTTFDSLSRMDSLVLADTALFQKILPYYPDFPCQIYDTSLYYIVESNQHRFSIFRIVKQLYWWVQICGVGPFDSYYCPMALEIEWWYQDNGSLSFKNATRVQPQKTEKPAYTPLKIKTLRDIVRSGMPFELYSPSGRLLVRTGSALKSLNVNALPCGILLYRIKPLNQSAVWGKVLTR